MCHRSQLTLPATTQCKKGQAPSPTTRSPPSPYDKAAHSPRTLIASRSAYQGANPHSTTPTRQVRPRSRQRRNPAIAKTSIARSDTPRHSAARAITPALICPSLATLADQRGPRRSWVLALTSTTLRNEKLPWPGAVLTTAALLHHT